MAEESSKSNLEKIKELISEVQKVSTQLNIVFRPILEKLDKLKSMNYNISLDRFIENFTVTHKYALKHGWLLPLSQFSAGNIRSVFELSLDDPDRLSQELCKYLKTPKYIERMYENWWRNKYFNVRKQFLNRGVQAHLEKDYIVSIPVLLLHVEGILRKHFNELGFEIPRKFNLNSASGVMGLITLKEIFFNIEKGFLSKALGKISKMTDDKENSLFNRGFILHGKCLDYHQEYISAQIIYILDTICYFTQAEVNDVKK